MTAALLLLSTSVYAVDFNASCYGLSSHSVFVSGFQRFVSLRHRDGLARTARYNPAAAALGYRYANGNGWEAGVSLSYEQGNAKYAYRWSDTHLKVRDATLGVGVFGKYTGPTGTYVQGSGFVGFANQKVRRGTDLANAHFRSDGSNNATRFAASLELGKNFELGDGLRMTPHVGFDFAHAPTDRLRLYDSSTASGSKWKTDHENFYEVPVGVGVAKDFAAGDWIVTPSLDLTLVSSLGHIKDENMNYRTGFAANVGPGNWKVYGIGGGHWGGRVTAGVKAIKSERFDVGFNYTYEGRKRYNDHRLAAVFGLKF